MLEQRISRADAKHIVSAGEMIENYPDDTPFPSALFFGLWQNQPAHVVIAYDQATEMAFFVTVYRPDSTHFEADYKTRRKK
jgi:hypothetical protein